jgi:hypothetical protein
MELHKQVASRKIGTGSLGLIFLKSIFMQTVRLPKNRTSSLGLKQLHKSELFVEK